MDAIGPAESVNSNPLDCFPSASAEDPLTLSLPLSPLGRGGPIIANPVDCFAKGPLTPALSREGRGSRACPLRRRSPLPIRIRLRMRTRGIASSPRRACRERGQG